MKEKVRLLFKDQLCRVFAIFAVIIVISEIGLIISALQKIPAEVPLFYSLHWGEQQLVPSGFLLLIPFLTALFLGLNVIISSSILAGEILWGRMMVIFSFLISLLTFYALVNTLFLFI